MTTATVHLAAYAASEHYETLWIKNGRTAAELRRLAERRTAADGTPLTASELIRQCEEVISLQNQAWMGRFGKEDAAGGPGR